MPPLAPGIVRAIDVNLPDDEMLEVLRTLAIGLDPADMTLDLVAEESVAGSGHRGSAVN